MSTTDFRTKTLSILRENINKNNNHWPIGLDIGYSGVKGMSPNSVFCFPSYAHKLKNEDIVLGKSEPEDIMYRDLATGDTYIVGAKAQSFISAKSSNETNNSLYGRNRYFSDIFLVIARVGLGIALTINRYGTPEGKKVVLQTGLPPKYKRDDEELIVEVLSGIHHFELKVGDGKWNTFKVQLDHDDIRVMYQPMGTLLSIASQSNGRPSPDAKKLFSSKVFVFDPGFGTVDSCYIKERRINPEDCVTFDDFGMKRVLQETCDELRKQHNIVMEVPAIQPYLEKGYVKAFSRAQRSSYNVAFEEILREKSKNVCLQVMDKLDEIYDYFSDTDYFVISGGLGAAWNNILKERFKNMETLTLIPGNRNDDLPYIFSNVRGYYLYLVNTI